MAVSSNLTSIYIRCIFRCMRTNIHLNDDLVKEAMKYSRSRSKRALVEEALDTFIRVRAEARRRESYVERLRSLRGKLADLRLRQRPGDVLREDRSR